MSTAAAQIKIAKIVSVLTLLGLVFSTVVCGWTLKLLKDTKDDAKTQNLQGLWTGSTVLNAIYALALLVSFIQLFYGMYLLWSG